MKLIIDIPDNWEEKVLSMSDGEIANCLYSICRGGTPLDDLRAEIEQLRNFRAEDYDLEQYCDYFDARIIFRDDALQIIDKYIGDTHE